MVKQCNKNSDVYISEDSSGCQPNNEQQQDQQSKKIYPPLDGGWGWLVLLACFIIHLFLPATQAMFGILFAHKVEDLKMSSTSVAWIFNISSLLWDLTGSVTGPLIDEFGWRTVALFGSILASTSIIVTSQATSFLFILLSFSIPYGIGGGLAFTTCHLCLPHYFEKKRGLAFSITMTGVSVGFFVLPLFFRYLQDTYGFHAAVYVFGAFFLHTVVCATFFHPIEWHSKEVTVLNDDKDFEQAQLIEHKLFVVEGKNISVRCTPPGVTDITDITCEIKDLGVTQLCLPMEVNKDNTIITNEECLPVKTDTIDANNVAVTDSIAIKSYMNEGVGSCSTLVNYLRFYINSFTIMIIRISVTTCHNFSQLRSTRVMIISLASGCLIAGYLNFILMVPLCLKSLGFSLQISAYCMSLFAICNAIGRLCIPFISDHLKIQKRYFFMTGIAIMTFSVFGFSFGTSIKWLMTTMCFFGFGLGSTMGLYVIVMIEVMGLEKLSSTISAVSLIIGCTFITCGPFVGFIRDVSDSYKVSNCLLGCLISLAFFLWLLLPLAKKYDRAKELQHKQTTYSDKCSS